KEEREKWDECHHSLSLDSLEPENKLIQFLDECDHSRGSKANEKTETTPSRGRKNYFFVGLGVRLDFERRKMG
ncbi:hypothetical protein HHI36_009022, partial [Cryptolaemus montrouzieri]